jgi:hypothetical protein
MLNFDFEKDQFNWIDCHLFFHFDRSQLDNLGLHPYTTKIINRRANQLAQKYPQYDAYVIKQFSKSDPLVNSVMKG